MTEDGATATERSVVGVAAGLQPSAEVHYPQAE